ncbi:MAG: hypothetical protein KatS3mg054_0189 [Chloroflexus sp.]|nr:MAG: hypothetical protein KatS3mg054_0189 [Chloroflexus sp.]
MFQPFLAFLDTPQQFLPSGVLAIDTITGGGIPVGHITDIVGEKGLGKTTLALHIAAKHLAAGHPVYYVDSEFSLDPSYARRFFGTASSLLCSPTLHRRRRFYPHRTSRGDTPCVDHPRQYQQPHSARRDRRACTQRNTKLIPTVHKSAPWPVLPPSF